VMVASSTPAERSAAGTLAVAQPTVRATAGMMTGSRSLMTSARIPNTPGVYKGGGTMASMKLEADCSNVSRFVYV
jgi:hypothetical protein